MTILEFMDKLNKIVDKNIKDKKDISKNEIYFFAEDEYQTFDIKIENIEIEGNKIFLS
jgi:hypothetical protein